MTSSAIKDYLIDGFVVVITLFSLLQVLRGITTGKITSPSTTMSTRDRRAHPIRFWTSMTYYVVWIVGTVWALTAYFYHGGRLPF